MKNKHIKMFESFSSENYEQEIANSIFENWKENNLSTLLSLSSLFEQEFWDEDRELTSGEKRAQDRDLQVTSKEQLAAIYLLALGEAEHDDRGFYLTSIPELRNFGMIDPNSGAFEISIPAFADAIGMESARTLTRRANEFKSMITGSGETPSIIFFEKVLNAFNFFSTQRPLDLIPHISPIIQDATVATANRDQAEAQKDTDAVRRAERNREILRVGEMVFSLIRDLKRNPVFSDPNKAERMAISRISKEIEMDPVRVKAAYEKFKMSRGL
jgi:hypothetical protein